MSNPHFLRPTLCIALTAAWSLSLGLSRAAAEEEGETSDAETTVKKSLAEDLIGKWRGKPVIDEETLKKELGDDAIAVAKAMAESVVFDMEFKADHKCVLRIVTLGQEQTLKGRYDVIKEESKTLKLKLKLIVADGVTQETELTFDGPDRFILNSGEDPADVLFKRVKKKEGKAEEPKQ